MKLKELVKQFIPMNYWNTRRKASIIRQQGKVADFWAPILKAYYLIRYKRMQGYNALWQPGTDHASIATEVKVIESLKEQGIDKDELPEIIQICFDSVDRNKNDYQVIRLTDITISEYIDLPDFVWRKREYVQFTRTFFSDLLRVALLSTYGGVWLDATILLTGSIPAVYEKTDFFMYQRSDEEKNKKYWENVYAYYFGWEPNFKVRMLSSMLFAQKESEIISTLTDLLLYFWKTQDSLPDYFCFQILFNELVANYRPAENCPIVNDCIPHIIQTKINGTYDDVSFEEALELSNIHKMTYFDAAAMIRLKMVLRLARNA